MFRRILPLAILLGVLSGAVAQELGPPDTAPPGAAYSGQTFSFSGTALSFSSSPLSLSSTPVGASKSGLGLPGAQVSRGVTVAEEKGGALRFTLNADLLFDFDKANLRPAADEMLRALVAQVDTRLAGGRYRIEGHTDGKGSDKYNDQLSLRRAKSVEAWLTRTARVPARRIATAAFGKRRPVVPNEKPDGSDDPEGRQKNRRVEILVLPPG